MSSRSEDPDYDPRYPDPGYGGPQYPAEPGAPGGPRLWRSRTNKRVAGVLGGLAEKFGLDAQPLRILYGIGTVFSAGLLAIPYVGLWSITRPRGAPPPKRPLTRSTSDKMIAGVIGGLAEKWEVSPTMLRIAFVLLSVMSAAFPGILVYLLLWMFSRPGEERAATPRNDWER